MRVERKKPPEPISPRWEAFLKNALRGVCLDEIQSAETRRADYSCLGGLIAVENKALKGDGTERIGNLLNEMGKRPDWPTMYGRVPLDPILEKLEDAEAAKQKFADRIGRTIVTHLKKANEQLEAHGANYPRSRVVRLVALINEDHEIYEPQMVRYLLSRELTRRNAERLRYEHIDAVIYLSERHATILDGRPALPILTVLAPASDADLWKADVTSFVSEKWANWNGLDFQCSDSEQHFETIEQISENPSRSEAWRIEYQRNPYMRTFSFDALRCRFDETQAISLLSFAKDSPFKPPHAVLEHCLRDVSHLMIEMGERGISAQEFSAQPHRLAVAGRRLGFPEHAVRWLANGWNSQN